MELSKFVSGSLLGIIQGIQATQDELAKVDASDRAVINPRVVYRDSHGNAMVGEHSPGEGARTMIQEVEFDVVVTAERSTKATGGVGAILSVVSVGAKGEAARAHSEVNRLRFTIPVVWPTQ